MLFAAIGFTYSFSIADFVMFEKRSTIHDEGQYFRGFDLANQPVPRRGDVGTSESAIEMIHDSSQLAEIGDIQTTLLAAEQNMGG